MSDEIKIRAAGAQDAPVIVGFNQAMARETEGKELATEVLTTGVSSLLAQPQYGFYLIAESAGEPAGCLMITYEWSDWRNKLFWWVQSVYIAPRYRRRGVYSHLYAEVKRRAALAGNVCGFRLYVEKENASAQVTYRSLGMSETHYHMYEELLGE